jgi:hypothetical protein
MYDDVTDTTECFHEMMNELGGEVYKSGPMTEWASGEFMFYLFVLPCIQPFWSDFIHRCLSIPRSDVDAPTPHATLNSPAPTPLLREWAKAKLTHDLWRDALLSVASVSSSI